MPFIVSEYGSYANFKSYFGNRFERTYIVKLINNDLSTSEVLTINPDGITQMGITLQRHEFYNAIMTSITANLTFYTKSGGGGDYLYAAFNNKGIKADVECHIYKKNPDTNDFDVFYTGKVDFSPESFNYKPNENELSCVLHEIGLQQKLLSRDEIDVDLTQETSIDGVTITDPGTNDLLFKAIDIYLKGEGLGGNIYRGVFYTSTGSESVYYTGGENVVERTSGRINFETPTEGKIYENSSDTDRYIKFYFDEIFYSVDTNCDVGSSIDINVYFRVYNSGGTKLQEDLLYNFNNTGEATKSETGDISGDILGYYLVPAGGYVKYYAVIDRVYNTQCNINAFFFGDSTDVYNLSEKSLSIGDSSHKTYNVLEALRKNIRLITSEDDSFYYTTSDVVGIRYDYLTSGRALRGFPQAKIHTNVRDIFKTLTSLYPKALIYDSANSRFQLVDISDVYKTSTKIHDFGKVRNLVIKPGRYFNRVTGGCENVGSYEQEQGVYEFNVQSEHTADFEIDTAIDFRAKYRLDSIGMELSRRMVYKDTGGVDYKDDNAIFWVRAIATGTETAQDGMSATGFDGIEQYYNQEYNFRENLIRQGKLIKGLFHKETGTALRFAKNSKDINITYYSDPYYYEMNYQIQIVNLDDALFIPIIFEFDSDLSDDDLQTIMADPHGYCDLSDDDENVYHIFINSLESKDYDNTCRVIGIMANI